MILALLISCLSVAVVVLLFRHYLLKRQIKRMAVHLKLLARDEPGEILHIELIDRDLEALAGTINENILLMEALRKRLARQDESLKESIGNIGHDLRTPLTSVIGNLAFAKQAPGPEAQRSYLVSAENKARLMKNLLDKYHELAVFESPGYSPVLSDIDINQVMRQFLADTYDQFAKRDIAPVLRLPDQAVVIRGNKLAIERILLNLFGNALKYSSGEIGICLEEDGIMTIWNSLSDGQPPEVSRLFERFYQSDPSRKNSSSGLGLYIVKMLAEKQGASVDAACKDGGLAISVAWMREQGETRDSPPCALHAFRQR